MNAIYNVFIDGKEGTTGLRIREYLSAREDINVLHIDQEKRKDKLERVKMIEKSDVAILCLPDEASEEIMREISAASRVLDTSTAHRVNDEWVYGLPELSAEQKKKITNANRVAVPGCHATGFILLAGFLVRSGIVRDDYPFVCHSVTGYSGGGKKMIAEYETGDNDEYKSPRQYGLSQRHKHIPEMVKFANLKYAPVFTPVVANYYCGMAVSVPIITRLLDKRISVDQMKRAINTYYKDCDMVNVADENAVGGFFGANRMADRNAVQLFVYGNDDNIIISARYDNLGKGAAGGAVQCMNLMLGTDEYKGLI